MSSRSSGSGGSSSGGGAGTTVPLAVLLRREVVSERTAAERPELHTGLFNQAKKGEDFTFLKPECERIPGVPSSSFSAFGVSASTPRPLIQPLLFPRDGAPRSGVTWIGGPPGSLCGVAMCDWLGFAKCGGDEGEFFPGMADFHFFLWEMKGLILERSPLSLTLENQCIMHGNPVTFTTPCLI
jgi:hypothetical protein